MYVGENEVQHDYPYASNTKEDRVSNLFGCESDQELE